MNEPTLEGPRLLGSPPALVNVSLGTGGPPIGLLTGGRRSWLSGSLRRCGQGCDVDGIDQATLGLSYALFWLRRLGNKHVDGCRHQALAQTPCQGTKSSQVLTRRRLRMHGLNPTRLAEELLGSSKPPGMCRDPLKLHLDELRKRFCLCQSKPCPSFELQTEPMTVKRLAVVVHCISCSCIYCCFTYFYWVK